MIGWWNACKAQYKSKEKIKSLWESVSTFVYARQMIQSTTLFYWDFFILNNSYIIGMSNVRVHKKKRGFSVLMNECLEDSSLSFKAKGIWAYLMTKPDDWQARQYELVKASKDGKDKVSSGVKELIDRGYISRSKYQDENGHWHWVTNVFETRQDCSESENPESGKPDIGKPESGKPAYGKPDHIINTDSINTNLTNTDKTKADSDKSVVPPVFGLNQNSFKEGTDQLNSKKFENPQVAPAPLSDLEKFYIENNCTELPKFKKQPSNKWFRAKRRELGLNQLTATLLEIERYCREDNTSYSTERKQLSGVFATFAKKTEPKLIKEAKSVWNEIFFDLFGEEMTFGKTNSLNLSKLVRLVKEGANKVAQSNFERKATDLEVLQGLRLFLNHMPEKWKGSAEKFSLGLIVHNYQQLRIDARKNIKNSNKQVQSCIDIMNEDW